MQEWIASRGSSAKSAEVSARLVPMMEACGCDYCKDILEMKDWLVKKSQWIIGGDGWGYDIGFGGVDHVLASGQDVNILVVDTEVYSNTGGQSSKSTPVGAVAKFASAGKRIRKKDLGAIAMTYGYVYVAQVSIGASQMQLFNVLKEAEAYPGPSLVIAYAPCINHGIKGGMTRTQTVGKEAVACGYWHLWHYNRQEPVRDGLEGARLVEVPRLPDEGGALHFAQKVVPGRGRRAVRSRRGERQMALQRLPAPCEDGILIILYAMRRAAALCRGPFLYTREMLRD